MAINKADQFAQAAQAAGWAVKRKDEDNRSVVHARRGVEQFSFSWVDGRFEKGRHRLAGLDEEWSNVKAATRALSEPERAVRVVAGQVVALPFDIELASDQEVLEACAGRVLTWVNSLDPTGEPQEARVPRGGMHYKIEPSKKFDNAGERILTFPDMGRTGLPNDRGGWRSVALSSLRSVT